MAVTPVVTDDPVSHLIENDLSLVAATGDPTLRPLADYLANSIPSQGEINVRSYGALGDGVTDDTAAIQAALTAGAAQGRSVWAPEGDYRCASGTVITNPGVRLIGDGIGRTRFIKSGLQNLFSAKGTAFSNGSNNTLAANAAAGERSVTLGAGFGAAYSVGQLCMLKDEGAWAGLTGPPPRNGEFVTIQAIAGDVITFWSPLRLSYTTANTARLIKPVQLAGVEYRDFTVVMDDTFDPALLGLTGVDPSDPDTFGFAFFGLALFRPVFSNIEITHSMAAGIALCGCLNARVTDYQASDFGSATSGGGDPSSDVGTGGYGYGVLELELNEGLVASNLNFERIRHGYSNAAGNNFYGNAGVPTGSLISNGIIRDAKDAGWDTHPTGDAIVFQDLKCLGSRASGFQIRSRRQQVMDCSAENTAAAGLWIRSDSGSLGNECHVSNFRGLRTNLFDGYPSATNWTNYGCIIDDANDTFIDGAYVSYCSGPLLTVGAFIAPVRMSYNNLRGNYLCQVTSTNRYAVHFKDIGASGAVRLDGLRVYSPDGRVLYLVRRDIAGDQIYINNAISVGLVAANTVLSSSGDDGYIDGSVVITNSDLPAVQQFFGPRQIEDFFGTALPAGWATAKGADGSATIATPIASITGGAVRLITGANPGATMALNGSQMSGGLSWKGATAFEFRIRVSALTNIALFIGLTDQNTVLEMPIDYTGAVISSQATDAVGLLFDTAAPTGNWYGVGVKADVDATPQNLGSAPVAATWERWRVVLTGGGSANFYREGVKVGTQVANAITPSTIVCLVVAAYSRGAATRLIDVDYILAELQRSSTAF